MGELVVKPDYPDAFSEDQVDVLESFFDAFRDHDFEAQMEVTRIQPLSYQSDEPSGVIMDFTIKKHPRVVPEGFELDPDIEQDTIEYIARGVLSNVQAALFRTGKEINA